MTVTSEHEVLNLQYANGRLVEYSKQEGPHPTFNGYEAGTSMVQNPSFSNMEKKVIGLGRTPSIQHIQQNSCPP